MNLRMVIPIEIAVIALLAGLFFTYKAARGPDEEPTSGRLLSATMEPPPNVVVSGKGGFAIVVPKGILAEKKGSKVTLRSIDQSLVVAIGPVGSGDPAGDANVFLQVLEREYSKVKIGGTQNLRVDDRKAFTAYGQAVNSKKVTIRFLGVVVRARPRNVAINIFTDLTRDAETVQAVELALLRGFTVLEQ